MEDIVQLPSQYKRAGFEHKLCQRGQYAFLYQVCDSSNNVIGWEVFKRLISKAGFARFGGGAEVEMPAKERKPNDESFGKWAWSIINYGTGTLKAAEYFKTLEDLKGDLKAFLEFRCPNPLLMIFELHRNGKPISMKIMGKPTNRTVRIDSDDIHKAGKMALEAFGKLLGSNFDIRGCDPVLVGQEYLYKKNNEEEWSESTYEEDELTEQE